MRRIFIGLLFLSTIFPIFKTTAQNDTDPLWIYYVEANDTHQTIWRTNLYDENQTEALYSTTNTITRSLVDILPANEINALLEYYKTVWYVDISFDDLIKDEVIDVNIYQIKVSPNNQEIAFVVEYQHCFSQYRQPESCFGDSHIFHINATGQITDLAEITQNTKTEPYVACESVSAHFATMKVKLIDWVMDNQAIMVQVHNIHSHCQSFPNPIQITMLPINPNWAPFVVGEATWGQSITTLANEIIFNPVYDDQLLVSKFDLATGDIIQEEIYVTAEEYQSYAIYNTMLDENLIVQLVVQFWGDAERSGFLIINQQNHDYEFFAFYHRFHEDFKDPHIILSFNNQQVRMLEANEIRVYDLRDLTINVENTLPENLEFLDNNAQLENLLFRDNMTEQFVLYDYEFNRLSEVSLSVPSENITMLDS